MPFDSSYTEHHIHGDDSREEQRLKSAGKYPQAHRAKTNWLAVLSAEKWSVKQVFLDATESKAGAFEIALGIVVEARKGPDIANGVDDDPVNTKSKNAGAQNDHDIHAIFYVVDPLCGQSSWRFWRGGSLRNANAIAGAFHGRRSFN